MLLLDDVVLRQVLAARDPDDRAMLVRLNLAGVGLPARAAGLLGRPRGAGAADRARHPSAGRHAALEATAPAPVEARPAPRAQHAA